MKTDRNLDGSALLGNADSIRWDTIFNAIGHPAIILDKNHHIVAANNASILLTGMPQNELSGRYCFEIFHNSYNGAPAGCPMQKMLESGVMESIDMEMEALNGTFLVSCTPILAADGSLDKIIHIATDITARKEMELKLVEESAFNRSIIYDAPEGLCVCHAIPEFPYVRFTVWNDRMTAITGYTIEEINAGGYYQTLYPDQELQARAVERIQKMRNGDNLAGENWRITDKQGKERVVAIWTSVLNNPDTTDHVLGFFIDVTEHKKLESALHDQKNFIDSLVRNSTGALFVLDRQHRVQVWNRACENLTGFSHVEIMGSSDHWKAFYANKQPTLADVILDGNFNELPKLYGYVSKSAHIPNGYKAEGWFEHLNGKDRYLMIEASPVYDSRGEMTHVIESINDLTESKTLEEQLLHAQKMESIGVLAGGIAHEFNNILAVILGYGQVMRKGFEPDSNSMNDLDQILTAAERAAVLTKGLLAFSRKQRVTLKNLDLNVAVHTTLKSFSRIMGDDIIVKESLDSAAVIIYADQSLVTQVIMNLMSNARDAMPQGGDFEISTGRIILTEPYVAPFCTVPPGMYARLSLSDSGQGMDEDILQRIFEPFFTTKDVGKGTGLGLSVVYGIVTQHNGYIMVSSAPGEGTRFDIYLPLVEQKSAKTPAADLFSGLRGGAETILLADDEPALLILFSEILSEMGYHVITAADGVEAVEKFAANRDRIKLSILDVQMRRKNGLQAYGEIRLIKPESRVLFITGFNLEQFQGELTLEQDTELLTKPFAPADLAARVRKILDAV